ncbi:hypothetical protein OG900_03100 [Streptomyces sp. NBC_00433]
MDAGSVPGPDGPAFPSHRADEDPADTSAVPSGLSAYAADHSLAVGRADHVAYYAAPRGPVSWPQQVGVIPGQADCFRYRAAVEALDVATADAGTAVLLQTQVPSGTGGVGKTQLAAHYARRRWESAAVDLVVWITANTRDAAISAYAHARRQVGESHSDDPEMAARDFLSWLAAADRRRLVVLDDLADPADLSGLWPRPVPPAGRWSPPGASTER